MIKLIYGQKKFLLKIQANAFQSKIFSYFSFSTCRDICGTTAPPTILSITNKMYILLHTVRRFSFPSRSFNITIQAIDKGKNKIVSTLFNQTYWLM